MRSAGRRVEKTAQTPRPLAPTADHEQAGNFKVEFVYDYMGRRVAKQVRVWDPAGGGGAGAWSDDPADGAYVRKFVWAGWLMLMEIETPGGTGFQPVRSYTWGLDLAGQNGSVNSLEAAGGIGGLLAVHQAEVGGGAALGGIDAGDYAYFYDANGNVGQLVDWTAKMQLYDVYAWTASRLVARYEYDPYGTVIGPDTDADGDWTDDAGPYATANAVRFSTKYFDDETGLGYWGYRYYSPTLGRWISRDPIGDAGGTNIYAYVVNSPQMQADDLGLQSGCCGPDVTEAVADAMLRVYAWFIDLDDGTKQGRARQRRVCRGIYNVDSGWDLLELAVTGGGSDWINKLRIREPGCGTGGCEGTVQYGGGCYRAGELNYILYGVINRLCYDSWDQWARDDENQKEWWRGGMTTTILGYRFLQAVGFLKPKSSAPAGPGGTWCRVAWASYGWQWGTGRVPIECQMEDCGTACCKATFDKFHIRVAGWWIKF